MGNSFRFSYICLSLVLAFSTAFLPSCAGKESANAKGVNEATGPGEDNTDDPDN